MTGLLLEIFWKYYFFQAVLSNPSPRFLASNSKYEDIRYGPVIRRTISGIYLTKHVELPFIAASVKWEISAAVHCFMIGNDIAWSSLFVDWALQDWKSDKSAKYHSGAENSGFQDIFDLGCWKSDSRDWKKKTHICDWSVSSGYESRGRSTNHLDLWKTHLRNLKQDKQ